MRGYVHALTSNASEKDTAGPGILARQATGPLDALRSLVLFVAALGGVALALVGAALLAILAVNRKHPVARDANRWYV